MTVINLNKARKAKAKAETKRRADENSVRYGRSKAEKELCDAQEEQRVTRLDAHRTDE